MEDLFRNAPVQFMPCELINTLSTFVTTSFGDPESIDTQETNCDSGFYQRNFAPCPTWIASVVDAGKT